MSWRGGPIGIVVALVVAACGSEASKDTGTSSSSPRRNTTSPPADDRLPSTAARTTYDRFDRLVDAYLGARSLEVLSAMFPDEHAIQGYLECPSPQALGALVEDMKKRSVQDPPIILAGLVANDERRKARPELAAEQDKALAGMRARGWKNQDGFGHEVVPKGREEGACTTRFESEEYEVLLPLNHGIRARKFGDAGWFLMFFTDSTGG